MLAKPHARSLFVSSVALLLLSGITGCSTPGVSVSLDTWKEGVETYVKEVGKGDPVALRDATYKGRPAFAQIGHPISAEGTDVIGLLLGHRPVQGRPSFIYLVGLVDKDQVEDIRVAVLQAIRSQGTDTQFKWLVGTKDDQAVKKYRAYRTDLYKRRFPQGGDPPPPYTSFPGEDDIFDLTVAPDRVTVSHPPSGAQWNLPVKSGG
jgi:hypothetical protein